MIDERNPSKLNGFQLYQRVTIVVVYFSVIANCYYMELSISYPSALLGKYVIVVLFSYDSMVVSTCAAVMIILLKSLGNQRDHYQLLQI